MAESEIERAVDELLGARRSEPGWGSARTLREQKRTMAALAQEALDVQDASNLSGVIHGFSRAVNDLFDLGVRGDSLRAHPVVLAWLDKINDMVGREMPDWTRLTDDLRKLGAVVPGT